MKLNTRRLRNYKRTGQDKQLEMLTCYDFQTARILDNTSLDLILVGDSVGNVVLGLENTIQVTLEHMITFGAAVKRGAPNKFVIVDLPFGTYSSFEDGINNASKLFKETSCEAIKLEGAFPFQLELIQRLTQTGIPIMGHIGLTPQSVHQQGGYYTHGKDIESKERLLSEAKSLEKSGVFALVLECVDK
ncbi:MAG: 3-methyl-2-oxobutanoate hydroxymethyltransferase, partial [Bdellovibrionales bacterium]|nr:3-methyl-2-oxobutanoate hydroxymethyltransferase [Bdellovibrionales bacterium]